MITLASGKAEFILILTHQFDDEGWREKRGEREHPRSRSSSASHSSHQQELIGVEVQQSRFSAHLTSAAAGANPQNLCSRQLPPFLQQLNVNVAEVDKPARLGRRGFFLEVEFNSL